MDSQSAFVGWHEPSPFGVASEDTRKTARFWCALVSSTPRNTKNGSVSDGSGLRRATSSIFFGLAPSTPNSRSTWYVSVASSAFGFVEVAVFGAVLFGVVFFGVAFFGLAGAGMLVGAP